MHNEPKLVLGDPRLDEDHAELHRLTLQLESARNREEVLAALAELTRHATEHFATEDVDLRAMTGNADAQCHVDEHASVLASLAEVKDWIDQNDNVVQMANLIRSLCTELKRWLPEHVQYMDAAVAAYRTNNRFGGVPVLFPTRANKPGT